MAGLDLGLHLNYYSTRREAGRSRSSGIESKNERTGRASEMGSRTGAVRWMRGLGDTGWRENEFLSPAKVQSE